MLKKLQIKKTREFVKEKIYPFLTIAIFVNTLVSCALSTNISLLNFSVTHVITKNISRLDSILVDLLLCYSCCFFASLVSYIIALRVINKIMPFEKFGFSYKSNIINEIKAVSSWIILYSICNSSMIYLGFSNFLYAKLSFLIQVIIWYLFVNYELFGYTKTNHMLSIQTKTAT